MREISAWLLLNKTGPPLSPSLYNMFKAEPEGQTLRESGGEKYVLSSGEKNDGWNPLLLQTQVVLGFHFCYRLVKKEKANARFRETDIHSSSDRHKRKDETTGLD